jgi:hypothetical protein
MMLQIFSWLSVRDRCQCVAPVCKKWSILARHPFLWKELSFSKDISKSTVLKLLHKSPLLRRLSLKDRRDTDAILRRVCKSNRRIETLEMEGCRGSAKRREVNGEILSRTLEGCPKFCNLGVVGTEIKNFEFYRLIARYRTLCFEISNASNETVLCYLKEIARVQNVLILLLLNGIIIEIEELIAILSQNF